MSAYHLRPPEYRIHWANIRYWCIPQSSDCLIWVDVKDCNSFASCYCPESIRSSRLREIQTAPPRIWYWRVPHHDIVQILRFTGHSFRSGLDPRTAPTYSAVLLGTLRDMLRGSCLSWPSNQSVIIRLFFSVGFFILVMIMVHSSASYCATTPQAVWKHSGGLLMITSSH